MPAPRPLVPARRTALALVAGCVVVVAGLGLRYHDQPRAGRLDSAVYRWVLRTFDRGFLIAALHLADLPVVVGVLAVVVVGAVVRRRWDVVVLAVVGPAVSLALTEWVLKPLVHRTSNGYLAYPSGHETGFASMAAVLAVLLVGVPLGARIVGWLGLLVLVALVGVSLVGRFYHYATDTVGAAGLSLAVVLLVGLALDRFWRPDSPFRAVPPKAVQRAAS